MTISFSSLKMEQLQNVNMNSVDFSGFSHKFDSKLHFKPLCNLITHLQSNHKQLSIKLTDFQDKFLNKSL